MFSTRALAEVRLKPEESLVRSASMQRQSRNRRVVIRYVLSNESLQRKCKRLGPEVRRQRTALIACRGREEEVMLSVGFRSAHVSVVLRWVPWVDDLYVAVLEVGGVARDDGEASMFGDGGDLSVELGHWTTERLARREELTIDVGRL